MIRRALLFAFLLALAAAPARANVGLVTGMGGSLVAGSDENTYQEAIGVIKGVLKNGKSTFQEMNWREARTEWCRTGTFGAAPIVATQWPGASKHFDVVVHFAVGKGANCTTFSPYCPESLLYAANWPANGQVEVFFYAPSTNSNVYGGSGAEDSLWGVFGATQPSGSYPAFPIPDAYWVKDRTKMFKYAVSPGLHGANVRTTRLQGYRPIVGLTCTAIAKGGFSSVGDTINCHDCDSLITPVSGFADPDTALIWVRYPYDAAKTGVSIFCVAGVTGAIDARLVGIALALADSISGGKVFEDKTGLPFQTAVVVEGAGRTGTYSNVSIDGGGMFLPANSHNDSTNVKAGIDSLAQYAPFTVAVDVDSISPQEVSWWNRARPNVKFTPQTYNGVVSGGVGGAASQYRLADVYGARRTRWFLGSSHYACSAASDTGAIECQARYAIARAESIFGGKSSVDHVLLPPSCDYIPVQFNRGYMPNVDSLYTALYWAGFRGVVVDVSFSGSNPNQSFNSQGGSSGANPLAYGVRARDTWPIYATPGVASSGQLGVFRVLYTRGWQNSETEPILFGSHDLGMEHIWGALGERWYPNKPGLQTGNPFSGSYYTHFFDVRLTVHKITAFGLGGTGPFTGAGDANGYRTPKRPGFYSVKWMANAMAIANGVMIPGKTFFKFCYLEDLRP